MGVLMGAKAPPMPKNGHFKAEGLNIGWVGKIRNNRNFRIIGQGMIFLKMIFIFISLDKVYLKTLNP